MANHFEAQTGTRRARREKHDAQRQDKRKHDFAVLRERPLLGLRGRVLAVPLRSLHEPRPQRSPDRHPPRGDPGVCARHPAALVDYRRQTRAPPRGHRGPLPGGGGARSAVLPGVDVRSGPSRDLCVLGVLLGAAAPERLPRHRACGSLWPGLFSHSHGWHYRLCHRRPDRRSAARRGSSNPVRGGLRRAGGLRGSHVAPPRGGNSRQCRGRSQGLPRKGPPLAVHQQ